MSTPANVADTYNWDTAYAVRFGDVNSAIAAEGSTPASFSGSYTDGFSGTTYDVTGNFGPWALSGGSGNLVQMSLPITSGSVVGGGDDYAYIGAAVIQVNLLFIPQPGAPPPSGQNMQLVVDNGQAATVLSFTFASNSPWSGSTGAIQEPLQTWLNANLESFNQVFSVVNIGAVADQQGYQWLKPTTIGYAVNTEGSSNPDDYVFGVLALVLGDTGTNLDYEISPNAIPAGANSGFLISQSLFLEQMFQPGMYMLFNNSSASDFVVNDDGSSITNVSPLTFQQFQLNDGTIITDATVDTGHFIVTAFDTQLQVQFIDLNFYWKSGFTLHLDYNGFSTMSIDANGFLQMPQSGVPSITTTITQSEGAMWAEIAASVAISIGASIAGALIGGALGPAADAAEEAGEDAAENAIDDAVNDDPDETDFDANGVDPDDTNNPAETTQQNQNDAAQDLENANNDSYVQQFKGFFGRNWAKMLGAAIGSAFGSVPAITAQILKDVALGDAASPYTFTAFTTECVNPIQWPSATGFKLVNAQLNRSLQLGINLTYDTTPK